MNTDASVQRLKGPTRPLQNETARATVMASLAPVDLVVLFDEDTPFELIQALRPDVLVKGADYSIDQVVGADLVHGWGGTVLLVELQAGPQHDRHDPADDRSSRSGLISSPSGRRAAAQAAAIWVIRSSVEATRSRVKNAPSACEKPSLG